MFTLSFILYLENKIISIMFISILLVSFYFFITQSADKFNSTLPLKSN